ncbi:uncharacterized protein M437DRAFT_61625 [Aureobasidium melanogenum CBS 110374]|uniref:Uncharacterized protein n=1 Tax=Aureobasidium melanogenum (strain CBS 110374) TaxID=1043003 RepID=A0A074W6K0_AURM1|nr:uncharacterized protein M437DRAFT_61625 [Aureobasidium melanogenum CBS 110374]KEQ67194.1 hypothetical protein M437DRAFT_61625 [Aureobasidium melanogenum CBS 110374]
MLAIQAGNATSDSEDLIMSDSNVSMSDAESESTRPPYSSIPDLPQLPALFQDDQGVVRSTVRQENGADPTGDQDGDGDGDDEDEEEKEEEDNNDGDGDDEDDDVEDEDIQDADEWPYHLGLPTRSIGTSSLIQAWESVCSF